MPSRPAVHQIEILVDSVIFRKVSSTPVTIFGHGGVAGRRHGREADFGTDGCDSFKKTLRPGGGGPRKRPQSGQRRRAPFWPRVRGRNRAPFWAKNQTFSFFFRATARTGRWHFAFMSPTALRFYLIRPGGMPHMIWTQWAARD